MIIPKLKTCDGECGEEKRIWKNHKGKRYCQYCWNKINPTKIILPMNDKRKVENEIYKQQKAEYIKEHPICEFEGCNSKEIEIHHKFGKTVKLLYDRRYFMSICRKHHNFTHENVAWAIEKGYIIPRNNKI